MSPLERTMAYLEGRDDERERCAKLAEEAGYEHTAGLSQFWPQQFLKLAEAIRSGQEPAPPTSK